MKLLNKCVIPELKNVAKKIDIPISGLKKQDLISSIMSSGKMTISKIVVTDS